MKKFYFLAAILLISQFAQSQILKSYLQFANHTELTLTTEYRIDGEEDMVQLGQDEILPWQNPNFPRIGEYETVVILDIVFDIYINHERDHYMAKCDRFSFTVKKTIRRN